MPDSISWSFNAAASSGGTSKASGKTAVDAVMVANRTIKKGAAAEELALQLETAAKVALLAITSSSREVTVKVGSGAGAKTVTLTGPLVLHGDAVKLFADDLGKITVSAPTNDASADVSILVGINLA
jgi:hypothetical protein